MEVNLIVANGKLMGKKIPIASSKFLIGRGEECNLRPQSNLVSRQHCLILVEKDSAAIEDLGSTNGTIVNGEKLAERRALNNGDRIKVGMLELEVQVAVAGKKKAGVHSVGQAAARTVAAAAANDEDFDVSRWLGEDDETTIAPPRKEPSVGDDTMAGKSLVDTTAIPVPPPHQQPPQKKEEEKQKKLPPQAATKAVGKMLHPPAKPLSESSSTAADDALRRHFLHKKNP
ncbi:MAG: FHA domain-containing protein [Thermoguttaceae bacterium]|jgi:predicted component of type VI protein secretion system